MRFINTKTFCAWSRGPFFGTTSIPIRTSREFPASSSISILFIRLSFYAHLRPSLPRFVTAPIIAFSAFIITSISLVICSFIATIFTSLSLIQVVCVIILKISTSWSLGLVLTHCPWNSLWIRPSIRWFYPENDSSDALTLIPDCPKVLIVEGSTTF